MRLFTAISLSDSVKDALTDVQRQMYDGGVRGNFTPAENLHLTLAFIGEYPDPEPVLAALGGVVFTPFTITLERIGCFGALWWAGLETSAPLSAVERRVRRALALHGIPFDKKKFSPHITLLRKAQGPMPELRMQPSSMEVCRLSLMRSDRGKRGMRYTEIGEITA